MAGIFIDIKLGFDSCILNGMDIKCTSNSDDGDSRLRITAQRAADGASAVGV